MVRTTEVARMSTGATMRRPVPIQEPPRSHPTVTTAQPKPRKAVPSVASRPRKVAFKAAPKAPLQLRKQPVRKAAFKSLKPLPQQSASETPTKQPAIETPNNQPAIEVASKQPVTKPPSIKPATKPLPKQPATKTLSKQATKTTSKKLVTKTTSKKLVTKTLSKQAATTTPSKQLSTEASPTEIDISISITCQHCKKRQRLDTEVIQLCRREEKRKRIAKAKNHPEGFIDLSQEDSVEG